MVTKILLVTLSCFIEQVHLNGINRSSNIFPADYDKYNAPWKKGHPAEVYIQQKIMDLDHIDDNRMQFSVHMYMYEYWKDHRLNLTIFEDPEDDEPIFPTYYVPDIWVPDLVFDNTREGKLFHLSLPNSFVVIKDGYLRKTTRYNVIVGCHMDFLLYPMDTQKCFMKLAFLANPDHKATLKWVTELPGKEDIEINIELMYEIIPLKYELLEPAVYKTMETWEGRNYTYLYTNFTFVRRLSGSLFNVYVPSTLVVFLSWISFWVNIEAVPARVTLGVTSLLTLGTQVVQARSGLPAISYMTAMDVWLLACLVAVFSSLLEFAFSYQKYSEGKQVADSDTPVEHMKYSKKAMRIFKLTLCKKFTYRPSGNSRIFSMTSLPRKEIDFDHIDKMSRIAFPSLFFIFALIYWIYFLNI